MENSQHIKPLLTELISLLSSVEEKNWCSAFEIFNHQFDRLESEQDEIKLKKAILQIYGGMGSFSDLVLYRDHNVLVQENQQLEKLRKALFSVVSNSRV